MKLSLGHVSGHLDSAERVRRPWERGAAAVAGEDDLEALQQPRQELARDPLIVGAGLAVVAVRRRERERSIAPHMEGQLLLTVRDVRNTLSRQPPSTSSDPR